MEKILFGFCFIIVITQGCNTPEKNIDEQKIIKMQQDSLKDGTIDIGTNVWTQLNQTYNN